MVLLIGFETMVSDELNECMIGSTQRREAPATIAHWVPRENEILCESH